MTNVHYGSMQMKTIGRRVAQSYRANNPGEEPAKVEGRSGKLVNGYPDGFRLTIVRIAMKYCRQHNYMLKFIVKKRKRIMKVRE